MVQSLWNERLCTVKDLQGEGTAKELANVEASRHSRVTYRCYCARTEGRSGDGWTRGTSKSAYCGRTVELTP
jgi:hypothetical protein